MRLLVRVFLGSACVIATAACSAQLADEKPRLPEAEVLQKSATDPAPPKGTDDLIPLNTAKTVLLDKEGGKVILQTEVVLRAGLLEMLCCLKQTKEHESILSLAAEARTVHAGLLALGIEPGAPVKFIPEYQPPSGTQIDIFLMWRDESGKWHREPAQKWIRHSTRRYFIAELKSLPEGLKIPESSDLRFDPKHHELLWFGIMSADQKKELLSWSDDKPYRTAIEKLFEISQLKPMDADWVFAGSGFYRDEETGKEMYRAEGGDLICVANFASATLDVREKSTQSGDEGLSYEAWEERIPPLGTKVRVELIPVKKPAADLPDAPSLPKQPRE